jgi:hypothetical protein
VKKSSAFFQVERLKAAKSFILRTMGKAATDSIMGILGVPKI